MNFENVSKACLMIAEALEDEKSKETKDIITQIDGADSDAMIKDGIRKAVTYLKGKKKFHIADEIETKTKGFAF